MYIIPIPGISEPVAILWSLPSYLSRAPCLRTAKLDDAPNPSSISSGAETPLKSVTGLVATIPLANVAGNLET